MNPLIRPWRHIFDFRGRATRTEYLLFHVSFVIAFLLIELLLVGIVHALVGFDEKQTVSTDPIGPGGTAMVAVFTIFWGLFLLAFLIGHISVAVRRLHDHGEPGIKYLLTFIPLIGIIFWFMLVFTKGDDFENDYGYDPRQPEPIGNEALSGMFS